MTHVLILGCGFTGQGVARRFLTRGASVTVTSNRCVDGSAIRRAVGIALRYPSYRTGLPASLKLGAQ